MAGVGQMAEPLTQAPEQGLAGRPVEFVQGDLQQLQGQPGGGFHLVTDRLAGVVDDQGRPQDEDQQEQGREQEIEAEVETHGYGHRQSAIGSRARGITKRSISQVHSRISGNFPESRPPPPVVLRRKGKVPNIVRSLIPYQKDQIITVRIPLLLAALLLAASARAADSLDAAIDTRLESHEAVKENQKQVDEMADRSEEMRQEYRQLLGQIESLRAYNGQLERLVQKQEEKLASYRAQISNIRVIQQQLLPFMLRMIDVLGEVIDKDLPFLLEERRARVAQLRKMMDDPSVPMPEKFRRINEVYKIETDYGRTIEAYTSSLEMEGTSRTVDFLRLGRVGLYYQTLDGSESGVWDARNGRWQRLEEALNKEVLHGLQIARKQVPPDLLRLPVSAPEDAGS
ncbi:MAG: DUF3450 domain-containing protein [Gammaproteobacteria bacterium]|nr:MAG: DUF3450 domain-containing protein [Gammaproteobacteria bacterium]